jgi:hypothetical protein
MGRACNTNMARKYACRIIVRKPEEQRPLGRARRRWVDKEWILERERERMGWSGLD